MTDRPRPTTPLDACVHCGLCLPACPTYALTGSEMDAPRGRIDLVRGLLDGTLRDPAVAARHLDRCLGCRACETACPSGVRYGEILEEGRARLGAADDLPASVRGLLRAFASPAGTTAAMRFAALARLPVVGAVARALPGPLGAAARVAPPADWTAWSQSVDAVLPATAARRGAVALLPGCVMDHAFAGVHDASAALLRAAGFDVHVPRGPVCCGALHAHAGDVATARSLVDRLSSIIPAECEALVADAAGCGSHLREAAGPWRGRTFDVLEFLDARGIDAPRRPVAASYGVSGRRLRVAWSDPCHLLHGQKVKDAPRRLLASIPDVDLVVVRDADRCCGSAGVWNLSHADLAGELLRAKVEAVRDVAPDVMASANPGCQLQIAAGLRAAGIAVPVVHAVQILARSCAPA